MNQYTFRVIFSDGGTLITTVSAASRFVAEMNLCDMHDNIKYCDFIA